MARGTFLQWSLGVLVGACLAACGAEGPTDEPVGQVAAALVASPPGVPCPARAAGVIANSGKVFSNSNSLVDSYRSSLGAYGGVNIGSQGTVQAATTIVHNGGVIHGTETPSSPAGLAVVPVPAGATPLPIGSATPGSVNINNAAQSLTLAPGNYVAANINVNLPGAINVSPAGAVRIWVTGNLNLGGNENLNGIPENLQFLVTSAGNVNVNSGGKLFGFIYAPTSAVNLNSAVFGGVTGSTVTLNSGSAVHLDKNSACEVATSVSLANSFACVVTSEGGVECWGVNNFGQLGTSTGNACSGFSCSQVPVPVTGLSSGVTAVSLGGGTACAVTASGGVMCWGNNNFGQLGNNSMTNSSVPVQVAGLASGVSSVSVGDRSACAVKAGGGVVCWGGNTNGQLGNNTTVDSSVPVQVVGLTSGVAAVSLGSGEAPCALKVDGSVVCWGANLSGQLGNNSTVNSSVPVPVTGLSSGVSAISVGAGAACALKTGGGVVCWGSNDLGQLGNSTTTDICLGFFSCSLVPVPVTGLTSGVTALSSGQTSACAVTAGGGAVCWGNNINGELGNNGVSPDVCGGGFPCSRTPLGVAGLANGVSAVSVGFPNACALTTTGTVRCWGDNFGGQLGNGTTTDSLVPVAVLGFP